MRAPTTRSYPISFVAIVLVLLAGVAAGCGAPARNALLPLGTTDRIVSARLAADGLRAQNGAYFGAYVNFATGSETPAKIESDTEVLESRIGRPVTLHLHFISFASLFPAAGDGDGMEADQLHGRIPVVSWECNGYTVEQIANGAADNAVLIPEARQLLAHPTLHVFIRWFWEMNVNATGAVPTASPRGTYYYPHLAQNGNDCYDTTKSPQYNAASYAAAWKHIWRVFKTNGVTNVTWLWNPADSTAWASPQPFYPSPGPTDTNQYVDWIGTDVYDGPGFGFDAIVRRFYTDYGASGKPLMLAESGTCQQYQTSFMSDATSEMQPSGQMPAIKAFLYYDHAATDGPKPCPSHGWNFNSTGQSEFAKMGATPYFGGIVRGALATASGTGSSATLTPNSPYKPGTYVIAYLSVQEGPLPGRTIAPPSGWTLLKRLDAYGKAAQVVYQHVTGASEPSSYRWTWSVQPGGTGAAYGMMLVPFTGVDRTTPIDLPTLDGGLRSATHTPTTANETPALGGRFEIAFFNGYAPLQASGPAYAPPSGWHIAASNVQAPVANIFFEENALGLLAPYHGELTWEGSKTYDTAWFTAALNPALQI